MKKIISLVFGILAIAALSACRDDSGPYASQFTSYDIVVYDEYSKSGGSQYTLYRPDSDEPIVYRAPDQYIREEAIPVGDRLLLGYIPAGKPFESGDIRITGYSQIANDDLRTYTLEQLENSRWDRDPIYLSSIWRAGPYINVHGKLTYSEGDTVLRLGVTDTDLDNENPVPTLYLIYQMRYPEPNFSREFYASFFIGDLWHESWCEGVRVVLNNDNLQQNEFTFTKQ